MNFPNVYLDGDDGEVFLYQQSMNPVQRAFHECETKFRWLGGGVGGGKSVAALVEVLWQSWQYKDNYGFILRKTLPEINRSAHKDFYTVCPHWMIYEENKNEHWIDVLNHVGNDFMRQGGKHMAKRKQQSELKRVKGLSRIEFMSFEGTLAGETKFRSSNIGWYFIEQAESAYLDIYDALNERMRRKPAGRKAIFVSNPDGHNWLWRIFHPDSPDVRKNHTYFPIELADNPTLPADYHETLKATYDADKYEKMVLGSHDIASGSVFPELSRYTNMIQHFEPPSDWVKGIALDPGVRNPTAFLLSAYLPPPYEGIYFYHEYQEAEKVVSQHVAEIKKHITPQFHYYEIDPESKKREGQFFSTIIGAYNAHGIPFRAASNDVMAGVNRIKEYLAYDPLLIHPVRKEKGSPRLLISDRCPRLMSQLHECRFEEQKTMRGHADPPERVVTKNLHLVDCLRYEILAGGTPPLTAASTRASIDERTYNNPYEQPKRDELVDKDGGFTIAALIEQSHKIEPSYGQTTWLAT